MKFSIAWAIHHRQQKPTNLLSANQDRLRRTFGERERFRLFFLGSYEQELFDQYYLKIGINKINSKPEIRWPGYPYMRWNTYQKQAIHLNSKLIVKLVLDVRNIFQSKCNFSFQKYEYNLFYRQQLIFRHRN